MSKPETPCLPGCREEATYPSNGIGWRNSDGVRKIHAPACPNTEAEAPPAPKPYRTNIGGFPVTVTPAADFDPTLEAPPANAGEPPIDFAEAQRWCDEQIRMRANPRKYITAELDVNLARAYLALKAQLDALPADWWKDSSLKTWFPFTAQELADLKAQNAALEAERDNLVMLLAGSDYARVVEELERLRDLIASNSGSWVSALIRESDSIRAAREAGKA